MYKINFKLFFNILIFLCFTLKIKAQQKTNLQKINALKEVIVSDTRFQTDLKKTGKSVVVLTQKYLQANNSKPFHQILNQVPGVEVSGTHGNFANLNTYVRGGRNHTVVVLIDGELMTDPSGITIAYDLRNIDVSQIEQVEIVKGGLSAIYGSNAGTIINITTKKIKKGLKKGELRLEYGSWNTISPNVFLSSKHEKYEIGIQGNFLHSDGFSSAKDKNNTGKFDKDDYDKINLRLKGGYNVFDKLKLNFSGALDAYLYDYDAGAFKDSRKLPSETSKSSKEKNGYSVQINAKVGASYLLKKGAIRFSYSHNKIEKKYKEGDYYFSSVADGETQIGQFSFSKAFGMFKTIWGVDYQKLNFEGKSGIGKTWETKYKGNYTLVDPYFSGVLEYKDFHFHFASRLNTHSNYGNQFVYTVNPSYLHKITDDFETKMRINYSTNFVAPSLYQSYHSKYGNKNLEPSHANTIETGFSVYFQNKIQLDFAMYRRNENNGIIFKNNKYQNLGGKRKVEGMEWTLQYQFNEKLNFIANYSTANTDKKESFLRIPKIKYGGQIHFSPLKNLNFNLQYHYTGEREDVYYENFKKKEVVLAPIHLVDGSLDYHFLKNHFKIFFVVKNLLNRDYIGVAGYNTKERNFSFGGAYKF